MKKIPKRPASGRVQPRADAVVRPRPRRRGSIAPETPAERLDMAFLAALMCLPDQRARGLASDALVRRVDLREAAREIVEAAERAGWEDWRSLGVLADHAKVGLGTRRARR